MLSGISGMSSYYNMYRYSGSIYRNSLNQAAQTQTARQAAGVSGARRTASLETPVQPVRPAAAVRANEVGNVAPGLSVRKEVAAAEMAVRMRIQYEEPFPAGLPGQKEDAKKAQGTEAAFGATGAQKAAEEGKCQTCEERKYQDGSDDMGVSFKTPTQIDPGQAASAVRGHEMEHVVREQAKAKRENRRVVSQSVALHTSVCPECGRVFISGGTTRTTTVSNPDKGAGAQTGQDQSERRPFSAVA